MGTEPGTPVGACSPTPIQDKLAAADGDIRALTADELALLPTELLHAHRGLPAALQSDRRASRSPKDAP